MSASSKSEQVDLRLSPAERYLIEKAATLSGRTVRDFILGTALERAREVLREMSVIELSGRNRDRLLAALDDERAGPGLALRRAARRHERVLG